MTTEFNILNHPWPLPEKAAAPTSRERFEAAIIARFKESGFLEVEIRVECLMRDGEGYYDPQVSIAWWAWEESQAVMSAGQPSPCKAVTS